ncbi:NAD-dependent succinate-semialdehyde dehydrogenase [Nocardioides imazamoxiresistens]|uniref:NAD-dependent succinate-semialdehyde dehydrogenase n=1 Tax=Nocardioides imazamoxiresistens TaxID=3231893 RepID=UPI003F68BAE0
MRIGGEQHAAPSTFVVDDPGTGAVLAEVADGDADAARAAVDAAAAAAAGWRAYSPRSRSDVLRRAHELVLADIDRLALLVMAENGKPEADARAEVAYAAEFLRWYSEEAVRPGGSWGESPAGGTRSIVTHQPVGVAALVTPWNFPAAMITRKVGPALAAGCTVVVKPAAETPLTALALVDLLTEAGVPAGVVNVVPSTDPGTVVGSWLADERVRKVSFTGSTRIGRLLLGQAADRVLLSSMELGGNAPFVVTADADVDAAVRGALVAKFRNGGQACTAANRFLVHEAAAERFTTALGEAVTAMRVGHALGGSPVEIGPMITRAQAERIDAAVAAAEAAGARVRARAEVPDAAGGSYVAPVVLDRVEAGSALVADEIFGPVAPIVTWGDGDDVVALANASEYGLAAYVYAGDLRRALELGEAIEAGMVGVNRGVVSDPSAPFGGVKQSGIGREGARDGLLEYTETKFLSVDWPA